jgi:adenosylhomocysteine nucleosidase
MDLICSISGIGKVNATLYTQKLIDNYQVDCVINFGISGSLTYDLALGDVVIATDTVHADIDCTIFDFPYGQIPNMNIYAFNNDQQLLNLTKKIVADNYKIAYGRIASGDQFIHSEDKANFIKQTFQALACDMESVAITHTCHINKTPSLVIRIISDYAGYDNNIKDNYLRLKQAVSRDGKDIMYQLFNLLS